jgi:predicted DNA-binding protein
MNKTEALDWALTYLREALGRDIEDNQEYQEAVKTLEEAQNG